MSRPTLPAARSEQVDPTTGQRVVRWTEGGSKNQHLYFTSPSVTADDRWLVFISDRDGHPNLHAIDRKTGGIQKLTRNTEGLLRAYVYPLGGRRGLSKASPCLDAAHNRVYYILNDEVWRVDLDGGADPVELCELPAGAYTAFNHVSPDGRTLCVPFADARAFEGPMQTQWEQLRQVPEIMRRHDLRTQIILIDTANGRSRIAAEVPFWVTHVQFDPAGSGRVIFNKEGQFPTTGIPLPDRIWCLDTDGSFRPLAPEADDEWRSHENWCPDGSAIVYHGSQAGEPFVAARTWDGMLLRQASLAGIALYHATGAIDGRRLFIDKPDGWIALVDPEATGPERIRNLCRHGSSCRDQDAHVHPITSQSGNTVVFTSDTAGQCDVYEVKLPAWALPAVRKDV